MVQELPRIAVGAGNGEDQVVEMVSTSGGEHHALPTAACYMFIYPCIQTEQPQVKLCMTMPLLMYDEYHPGTKTACQLSDQKCRRLLENVSGIMFNV